MPVEIRQNSLGKKNRGQFRIATEVRAADGTGLLDGPNSFAFQIIRYSPEADFFGSHSILRIYWSVRASSILSFL